MGVTMSKIGKKYTELVLKLKSIKDKRNLTVAQIMAMVEAQTEAPIPSETTVSKVFSPHGEDGMYVYDSSLRALCGVLLGYFGDGSDFREQSEEVNIEQLEAYRILIDEKNAIIGQLGAELTATRAEAEKAHLLQAQVDQLTSMKDYLKSECESFRQQIERLLSIVEALSKK